MPSGNVSYLFKPFSSSVKGVVGNKGAILDIEIVSTILVLPIPRCSHHMYLKVMLTQPSVWGMEILFLSELLLSVTSFQTNLHMVLLQPQRLVQVIQFRPHRYRWKFSGSCGWKKMAGGRFLFVLSFQMLWDTGGKPGSVAAILPPWSVNFRLTLTLQQAEKQKEIVFSVIIWVTRSNQPQRLS